MYIAGVYLYIVPIDNTDSETDVDTEETSNEKPIWRHIN